MMKIRMKQFGLLIVLLGCTATPTFASENGGLQYGLGSAQFFAGLMPPDPGFYINNQFNYYTSDRLNDGNGHKIDIPDFKVDVTVDTVRILYVSDTELTEGWKTWYQIVLPYILQQKVSGDTETGLADITLTTGLRWQDGAHSIVTGIDYALPTGSYHANEQNNIGTNHWSIQPVFSYHYLNHQDPGWEFAIAPRYIFNSKNSDTDYKSGQQLVVDYSAGYNIEQARIGVTGYWLKQVTDDTGAGVENAGITDGNRTDGFAIGPSLAWHFSGGSLLSASYQKEFAVKHKAEGSTIWLNFATKL
jgi:hypothetical protein